MSIRRRCETCGLVWQVGRIIPVKSGKYECPKCEMARMKREKPDPVRRRHPDARTVT